MENKNLQFNLSDLKIDIDGNELVHSIRFSGEYKPFKNISKSLTEVFYKKSFKEIWSLNQTKLKEVVDTQDVCSLELDLLLGKLRADIQDFKGDIGGVLKAQNKKSIDLLCRCKGLTAKDIEDEYYKHKGVKKTILIETEVCGVCSTCKPEFDALILKLEEKKSFINGRDADYWKEVILNSIDEFYMVCPPDYSNLKFEIISLSVHGLKIRCHKEGSSLKRLEIQSTLENYLNSEVKLNIPMKVIT